MEFSKALNQGAILIPSTLFDILDEVFSVKNPLASGLAVARSMNKEEIEQAIRSRSYLFHDTSYILVDSNELPEKILWLRTVYVYTNSNGVEHKNIARPRIIDPMPCRRLYGDPIALDELVVCAALRPLIGREVYFKTLIFKARKKIIDVDVEGLCRGITSYARRNGGVTVYLPVILRQELDNIANLVQVKGIDPEFLRSGDIEPLRDFVDRVVRKSIELAGLR